VPEQQVQLIGIESMNKTFRNLLLTVIGVALLPLIFTAIQGLLARFTVPSILILPHALPKATAISSVIYVYGVIGSAVSAMLLLIPLGLWVNWRPWLTGATVGVLGVVELAVLAQGGGALNYVEYASLIVFSIVAAEIGGYIRRARNAK
jgi:hypothetical protein